MEYKKHERTKNLTLRDIRVGDWVQCWDKITQRYTPPEKITAIFDDGTVYTAIDDEQGDPFEYDISEVDALPITPDILKGFGFDIIEEHGRVTISYKGNSIELYIRNDQPGLSGNCVVYIDYNINLYYIHEMIDYLPDIKLEWKGVEK